MRCVDNPPNPFDRVQHERLESAPSTGSTIIEEQAKSILTENHSPDIPFRWSVNPYRGCRHSCAYCYARRTHEYLGLGAGTDFGSHIVVKLNAPELLEQQLSSRRWRGESITFSGVTDCYQPLEAHYGLTRRCLEVCLQKRNPVAISTKSSLVTRDTDLLVELGRQADVHVCLSIAFADVHISRRIEPYAPSPEQRFKAMHHLAKAGVPVSLLLAPVIPGLNDRDIPVLLTRAAEAGACSAAYSPVRLPGSVADVFLKCLRTEFPDAAERVAQRMRELHGGTWNDPRLGHRLQGQGVYWESVARLFETTATRCGLYGGQSWRRDDHPMQIEPPRQLTLF
ncbi:MAG: PA0069 family radical SAM protein [Planctomycetota bacterium]